MLKQPVGVAPETGGRAKCGIGISAVFPQGPRFAAAVFSHLASPSWGCAERRGTGSLLLPLPSRKKELVVVILAQVVRRRISRRTRERPLGLESVCSPVPGVDVSLSGEATRRQISAHNGPLPRVRKVLF